MFALMEIREIYREYLQKLKQLYNTNEATVITGWVFEKIAGLQRADIIKNPAQHINSVTTDHLNNCLKDLLLHKPVQYVLGEAWFFKMKFIVNEQVLIPRPETEELVQLVVNAATRGQKIQEAGEKHLSTMLDIGTGSGCIAIAIKKNLPGALMHAIDISSGALSVAEKNAVNQQVKIIFLQTDFLDENNWGKLPVFDVIISNPPYIPLNEKNKLDKNVTDFEPGTALFVPDYAPLLFYKKIAHFGKKHLVHDGKIYVEFHEDFAKPTAAVFEEFYHVEIKKDLFGKERMLVAGRKHT